MALIPTDFTFPSGPLRASAFPDDDLDAALAVWIAAAEDAATAAGVDVDGAAARAYVLWRAYDALCQSPAAGLTSDGRAVEEVQADDEGRVRYADPGKGAPNWCALAARYRAEAAALLPAEAVRGLRILRPSRSTETGEYHAGRGASCRPDVTRLW